MITSWAPIASVRDMTVAEIYGLLLVYGITNQSVDVNGVYRPTYNWRVPSGRDSVFWWDLVGRNRKNGHGRKRFFHGFNFLKWFYFRKMNGRHFEPNCEPHDFGETPVWNILWQRRYLGNTLDLNMFLHFLSQTLGNFSSGELGEGGVRWNNLHWNNGMKGC